MSSKKLIRIDSTAGGGGDIWMRITGLYTFTGINPALDIRIYIPEFMRKLAQHTFGDRIFLLENNNDIDLTYTSLGFRHLLPGIIRGKRYISPYQKAVIFDKKNRSFKDLINLMVHSIADYFGLVQVPDSKCITSYQGFLEAAAIKQLRKIDYQTFLVQLREDYSAINAKLSINLPVSPELVIPDELKFNTLVFPTGTSRQFIPVKWAKENLPDAIYAFFHKDESLNEFIKNGLKTIAFYKEAADIIVLAQNAQWTITTDSFPSHLLQSTGMKCTITITEVLKSRIISPVFSGTIVDAEVECHPCLHIDSKLPCAAGYKECLNWKNNIYTMNIILSIPQPV